MLLVLLVLLTPTNARADESRHESFRFGQRAMGMGGAIVAYPGEPEASYYNPAALAVQNHGTIFSGGVQLWGFEWLTLRDGFRPNALYSSPEDIDVSLSLTLPSSSVLSRSFQNGRHVIAFSNYLTRDDSEQFDAALNTAISGGNYTESAHIQRSDSVRWYGGSYAWRFKQDKKDKQKNAASSMGISVFYVSRTFKSTLHHLRLTANTADTQHTFDTADSTVEIDDGSLVFRLGVFRRLTPTWTTGFSCSSPSLRLHGTGSISETRIRSAPSPRLDTEGLSDLRATSIFPGTCRAGVSWLARSDIRITSDVSVYAPTRYQRLAWQRPADAFSTVDAHFQNHVEAGWLGNVAVGVEWMITPSWPLRAGLFTNMSAASDIPENPTRYYPSKVHLWGSTISAGYVGNERSLNFGADFQWGLGSDVVPRSLDTLLGDPSFARIDREQYRLILFVSGAVEFAKQTTEEIIDDQ